MLSGHAFAIDKASFVAPENKALVVFIQNEKVDRKMVFTVFGSDRRCVAEVGGRQAEVLPVEPEPLILYVTGYNSTRRVEIYPEAGRTYFVRLYTVQKAMGAVPEVTLVRRGSEDHMQLRFWLDGAFVTRALEDPECYGRPLKERKNRTTRRLNDANADWKNGDDAYRDRHMLIEGDGLTADDVELF
jgi:hypothetical protein